MADQIEVTDYYIAGLKAKLKGQCLLAARYFRVSALYYENGELGPYNAEVARQGQSASLEYWSCRCELPRPDREMLDAEEAQYVSPGESYFIWSWRDFLREELHRIDQELKSLGE